MTLRWASGHAGAAQFAATVFTATVFAATVFLAGSVSIAQELTTQLKPQLKFQGPVKFFAGFAAGGQSDILARIIADQLKDRIGRPVIVENRTGAGGRIAVEAVKASPPDGSALVLANISQMSVAPLIYADLPYDSTRDFTPISKVVEFQIALATGRQTQAQDFAAMLTWLKANPGKGTSGNPGNGSLPHLYGLDLAAATGLDLRPIPYRGGAPIVAALTQGDLAMGWAGLGDFLEQHRAGQIRMVAVTGSARAAELKDVPTFTELGFKSVEPNGWIGFFAPAGLPADLVALYHREITAVLRDPGIRARLESFGFVVIAGSPDELQAQVLADLVKWKPVVEKAGIKP